VLPVVTPIVIMNVTIVTDADGKAVKNDEGLTLVRKKSKLSLLFPIN
jgi:hypothetical protein